MQKLKFKFLMPFILSCFYCNFANANFYNIDDANFFDNLTANIKNTWSSNETLDVFFPIDTWHNRMFYSDEKASKYNESPGGIGFGKSMMDKDNDWHSLSFIAFKDSNRYLQTTFNYTYQHNMYINGANSPYAGAGFSTLLTQRHEYGYIPLPLIAPVFGIGYKNINIQSAYVPGISDYGNVLFTWIRIGV